MKKIVAVSMVAVLATTVFLSGCNTSKKNESSSDTHNSTTSSLSSDVKVIQFRKQLSKVQMQ